MRTSHHLQFRARSCDREPETDRVPRLPRTGRSDEAWHVARRGSEDSQEGPSETVRRGQRLEMETAWPRALAPLRWDPPEETGSPEPQFSY